MQTVADVLKLPSQILISVKYLGPTDTRGSRWAASYVRSEDQTFRATVPYAPDNGASAALAVLEKVNADRRTILPDDAAWIITGRAHDDARYYYLATYPAS